MQEHKLKTWPEYYRAITEGKKRFELRKNDRNFQEGDTLILQEWSPETGYTGRVAKRNVTYILHGGQFGLPDDMCIMSLGNAIWE